MTTEVATTEWGVIQEQAQTLASSSLVPTAYRNKPENVILAALTGRELGWGPTTALRYIHIIEGKPTLAAEGMLAVVRSQRHSISGGADATTATARGRRFDTGDEMSVTFSMEDAKRAGLDRKNVWKQYPASMLWARAVSQLCRMLFPDCLGGVTYVPEELDADEPLTIPAVEPPPLPASGPALAAPAQIETPKGGGGNGGTPASAKLERIRANLDTLPDDLLAELKSVWKARQLPKAAAEEWNDEQAESALSLMAPYMERHFFQQRIVAALDAAYGDDSEAIDRCLSTLDTLPVVGTEDELQRVTEYIHREGANQ